MSNLEDSLIVSVCMGEQRQNLLNGEMEEVNELVEAIFESSSSSEESSSEVELHEKCSNYEATLDAMSEMDFKIHMRLRRQTVEYLTMKYSESSCVPDPHGGGRSRISYKKSMYMYIWYVSNTVTFRQLANLFGVAVSAAWSTVLRVTRFLISISNEHIKWPEGSYLTENVEKFHQKRRIPGVIGAIDCTHIVIKGPKEHKEMYFNRKKNYSIVLQAVVDANKKFIDITCGEPGSLHDFRVLRRSKIFENAENHYEEMFPNSCFIIGDSAYPSTKWLVSPFKDYGNLTERQRKFNEIHSSTRMVVENAFGLLKGRFRRLLKFTEQTDLKTITMIVVSICVLHNICISFDDLCDANEENNSNTYAFEDEFEEPNQDATLDRRQQLFNYLCQQNIV